MENLSRSRPSSDWLSLSAPLRSIKEMRKHPWYASFAALGFTGLIEIIERIRSGMGLMESWFGPSWLAVATGHPLFAIGSVAAFLVSFWRIGVFSIREGAKQQLEQTQIRQKAIDDAMIQIERRHLPYDSLVKMFLLQEQYGKLREAEERANEALQAAEVSIKDFPKTYDLGKDGTGDMMRSWQRTIAGHFMLVNLCREMTGLPGNWRVDSLEADCFKRMEQDYLNAVEAMKPVNEANEKLRHEIASLRSNVR